MPPSALTCSKYAAAPSATAAAPARGPLSGKLIPTTIGSSELAPEPDAAGESSLRPLHAAVSSRLPAASATTARRGHRPVATDMEYLALHCNDAVRREGTAVAGPGGTGW